MSFTIEDRDNGVNWVQIDRPDIYNISQWCRATGCGKQVNFRQISFKSEAELTMFLMRWENHDSGMR
jgi:hypothetical protein